MRIPDSEVDHIEEELIFEPESEDSIGAEEITDFLDQTKITIPVPTPAQLCVTNVEEVDILRDIVQQIGSQDNSLIRQIQPK